MSFFLGKNLFVGSTTWEKEKHEALHVLKNCFPPCRRVFLCCAWEESLQPRCCRGRTTGQARKGKWGREVKVLLVFHSPFASGLLPLPLSPCQTSLFFWGIPESLSLEKPSQVTEFQLCPIPTLSSSPECHLQGWALHPLPGQPLPMSDLSGKKFPPSSEQCGGIRCQETGSTCSHNLCRQLRSVLSSGFVQKTFIPPRQSQLFVGLQIQRIFSPKG